MKFTYSRLAKTETNKNIKSAYIYITASIILLVVIFIFGLPTLAKLASFLTNLKQSSSPVEETDTTPPAPPQIEQIPNFTNRQVLEIKGSSEPMATIILNINGSDNETLSDSDGKFVFSYSLVKGENIIKVTARDSNGNLSRQEENYTVVYDNEEPSLEILAPDDGQNFYGSKERQVVIQGKTDNDIDLAINDRFVAVSEDGSFSYLTSLEEGANDFNIKATDKAGNSTSKGLTLQFWR